MRGVRIDARALDALMPMHLVFDGGGRVLHAGPGLARVAGPLAGRRLGEAMRFRRPALQGDVHEVVAAAGRRLMVEVPARDGAHQRFRAAVVPLPQGGGLMHLAFGPDIARAVRRHGLDAGAFSPVDPVMETLFLLEAQALIRGELGALAERLDASLETAEAMAVTDRLTGLGNRRALDRELAALTDRARGFGMMHLDLDRFKAVNDTHGHAAGDAVLSEVGRILREETRGVDTVVRMGGDEFALILPDVGDPEVLGAVAERVLARLARPIHHRGEACRITGSIGIVLSSDYADRDAERMLSDADAALYRSKRAGRSRYAFANDDAPPRASAAVRG